MLTSRERIIRTYRHQEVDRMPMVDIPWEGTLKRWQKEGMPKNIEWQDYFGFDKVVVIHLDNSPRFEKKIIEKTDRYIINTTQWGATQKKFIELDSTPEVLEYYYSSSNRWEEAKKSNANLSRR
jgi:hypothetical protein